METLVELLEETTRRWADRPAMRIKPGFRTRVWRYRDVGDLVPRAARLLQEAGVEPGDRVLIWAVNRPEWGISLLALAYAGGVAVPLDVRSTEELAAKVAAATRPKLVLASQPTMKVASRLELPAIAIESLVDRARDARPAPRPNVDPDDLVEIVFTSGTTGEPKGAMLGHRNIVTNAHSLTTVIPLGPDTRLLSILPLSHMYGQNPGFLAPMMMGASVVYPTSLQPPVLRKTIRDNRVTMLLMVPQALKLLTNAIERRVDAEGKRKMFERLHSIAARLPLALRRLLFRPVLKGFGGGLRYVAVGGAALNPQVARRWSEMGVDVLQGYGATETSPVVSFTRIDHNVVGSVGQVIPGVEVRIASDGEVLVRGPNVFKGYWERPDATAAVLRDGWYHTGDHGTLDDDGVLTLRGRKKDMLAMPDGTKVYPDDIEAVLTRDARVRDASVVGLEREGGDVQVHAVLVLADAAEADSVVRDANARLGAHQQIRGHTLWPDDDFPRTPSLKVKKNVLIEWLQADRAAQALEAPSTDAAAQPRTDAERLVAQIDGVLAEAIHPDARLSSDLGLDSLGRVELLGLIEEELGASLDEDALEPDATLTQVQAMIDASSREPAGGGIFGWPLHPIAGAVRIGLWVAVIRPLVALFYRLRVTGRENLDRLEGPVLFAANHHLHNDSALIISAIPPRWRWKLSVAAAADDIFGVGWRGFGATLLGNAFPMAREGAVRRSLELLGARLDRGFSVLIYPEGRLTVGGPMQPFKSGTGLVAIHGATPVIPIKLKVHQAARVDAGLESRQRKRRGEVEVVFGKPMRFAIDDDPAHATAELERVIAAL